MKESKYNIEAKKRFQIIFAFTLLIILCFSIAIISNTVKAPTEEASAYSSGTPTKWPYKSSVDGTIQGGVTSWNNFTFSKATCEAYDGFRFELAQNEEVTVTYSNPDNKWIMQATYGIGLYTSAATIEINTSFGHVGTKSGAEAASFYFDDPTPTSAQGQIYVKIKNNTAVTAKVQVFEVQIWYDTNITLDKQGGTGGTSTTHAEYDNPMLTITPPTREGYEFLGYFDEPSTGDAPWRFYNADGTSARNYNGYRAEQQTLYAHWKMAAIPVTLNGNGATSAGTTKIYVDPDNTSKYYRKIDLTEQMTTSANPITKPSKTGYTFSGYYYNNIQYINANGYLTSSATALSEATTLTAQWTVNKYAVNFTKGEGLKDIYSSTSSTATSGNASGYTYDYGTSVNIFVKTQEGYVKPTSAGEWIHVNGTPEAGHDGATFRISTITVSTSNDLGTKYASLGTYPVSIAYDSAGISNAYLSSNSSALSGSTTGTSFTYGSTVYGFVVLKVGYKHPSGWVKVSSGAEDVEGSIYRVGSRTVGISNNDFGTQTAVGKVYTITLQGIANPIQASYGSNLPNLSSIPINPGYTFVGFFDQATGGNKYIDNEGHGCKAWDKDSDATLYSHWTKDMDYTVVGVNEDYDNTAKGITITITDPESGAVIKYRTTSTGEYNLDENPTFTSVGTYTVYYQIKATVGEVEYTTVESSEQVVIQKVDREEFETLIAAATTYYNGIKDTYADIAATLNNAISIANGINAVDDKTEEEINAAIEDLQDALDIAYGDVTEELIDAIAPIEYTQECKDKIDAARAYYDNLSADQKALVLNYDDLLHAEEVYGHIDDAFNAIKAIGDIDYVATYKAEIDNAREKYDALTTEEVALFDEDVYAELVDNEIVYEEMGKIVAFSDVKYTEGCREAIKDARDFYEDMSQTQKDMLPEKYLKALIDAETAFDVMDTINDIGPVAYSEAGKAIIDNAREEYEALTEDQKKIVEHNNYDVLVHDETVYANVDNDCNLINAIGEVEYTESSKEKIDKARNAYDALTDNEEKLLVPEETYQKLIDAERVYEAFEFISRIGDVEYTEESRLLIEAARRYYDSLSEEQKTKVDESFYIELTSAEQSYGKLNKNANILSTILLIFVSLLLLLFLLILLYLTYRYYKEKEKQRKEREEKAAMFIPVMLLGASHYLDAPFIALYVLSALLVLVIIADVIMFFLKPKFKEGVVKFFKTGKLEFDDEEEEAKKAAEEEAAKKAQEEAEIKQQKEYERMSKWGIESAQKVEKVEDPNGVLACGIIQNRKGKVYLFNPNGFEVEPGDVVEITDLAGEKKAVSVVLGNFMAPKERIVEPYKDIERILYSKNDKAALEAARKAQQEAEEQARREAEEAERRAQEEAEANAKAEAEEQARKEEEARIAMEQARLEEEDKRRELEAQKAQAEAEAKAREEAERKAAEERARIEAEEAARKAAEDKAKAEEEERARREAEALSLKESLAKAKATASSHKFTKAYICEYLNTKKNVEVNTRGNLTSTGLPLADTHYVVADHKKTCFIYVYETEGSIIILGKMKDDYAKTIKENHSQVALSAFPKQKDTWYSLIIDDSYTKEDVDRILDDLVNQTKQDLGLPLDEGISLKESIKLAKATASSHKFTKAYVCEYLRTKDNIEVNTRGNFTKTGLPLADTHYVVNGDKKVCFAYVYETEGSIILLAKMDDEYAKKIQESHSQVNLSAFPKQKNTWYSLIIDDTYTKEEFEKIIDDISK